MDNNIERLKKEYMDVPVPEELDFVVRKSLEEGRKIMKKEKYLKNTRAAAAVLVLTVSALTIGVNSSEAFAKTMSDIPVVGSIVKVLNFRQFSLDEKGYNANIETPEIAGLENKELQNSLNEKYYNENKELYEQFVADMKAVEENGGGHMGVDSGYVVKTDTDQILSIGRYVVNTAASSSTVFKYDTIDKKNEILITLKSLFKDESYVNVISENIKKQMAERMAEDDSNMYWLNEEDAMTEVFDKISPDQSFYITADNKLVISFDKYEVAPGYMGVVEFEIPTETIQDILVGNEYIK
ncbi:MAG TPA: anti-sigma factor [Clostridiales bacterium]|nr:anti-sigma factor [Clostridiales bacterium]